MAPTELEMTFIRCLMYLGAAPPKPVTLKTGDDKYDDEQIELYCKWLDYHGEVEKFYFTHVISPHERVSHRCWVVNVEDWTARYFDWLRANKPPTWGTRQVRELLSPPPTPAILHACKGGKK